MKHPIFHTLIFNIRREISLWACLFAVVFQMGAPLVQAALFNQAYAAMDGSIPLEICTPYNGVVSQGPVGNTPLHNNPTCDVCTLYHLQHMGTKAILEDVGFNVERHLLETQSFAYTNDLHHSQAGSSTPAIRAPPFFL